MNIFSIIVLFNPEKDILLSNLSVLKKLKINTILIDNTEKPKYNLKNYCFYYESNSSNLGIAKAQNIGIKKALDNKADIISFFDQDSKITAPLIYKLLEKISIDKKCIYSPNYNNTSGVKSKYFTLNKYGIKKIVFNNKKPFQVDVVISSGMFVNSKIFNDVGLMKDGFFIDYVDTEWCLRCKSKGISIFVIPDAVMNHKIGSNSIKLFNKMVTIHDDKRFFYQLRNSLLLLRYNYIPKLYAIMEIFKTLIRIIYISIYFKKTSIFKGIFLSLISSFYFKEK